MANGDERLLGLIEQLEGAPFIAAMEDQPTFVDLCYCLELVSAHTLRLAARGLDFVIGLSETSRLPERAAKPEVSDEILRRSQQISVQVDERLQEANRLCVLDTCEQPITFGELVRQILGDSETARRNSFKRRELGLEEVDVSKAKVNPLRKDQQQIITFRVGGIEDGTRNKVMLQQPPAGPDIAINKEGAQFAGQVFGVLRGAGHRVGQSVPDWSETDVNWLPSLRHASRFVQKRRQVSPEMLIRVNADTPDQARTARQAGIPGIGLCCTEALLLDPELRRWMHRVAGTAEEGERREALSKVLPLHQSDLEAIFAAISPYPAFVRLIDPPLQNFLPTLEQINDHATDALSDEDWEQWQALTGLRQRLSALSTANPVLGNRGCRLSVTHPEIMTMQVTAILQACIAVEKSGIRTAPAIVIPLVATEEETRVLVERVRSIASEVFLRHGQQVDYRVGVLIELPRAALCAGAIARHVDFVAFGTNDLTQMTFGFSREESSVYLQTYLEQGIFKEDPFIKLDIAGVGQLLTLAIRDIHSQRPEMEIGVCGDHCDDDNALRFFQSLDVDWISCPLTCIEKLKQTIEV